MKRTIKGSIGYGFKFSELGLTTHFEYLGPAKSHHMIKVKCKDCGSEFTRNDDILRCRSYTLRCRDCGAVVKVTNEERERVKKENEEKKRQQKERLEKTVIRLYSSGLSVRQIAISTNYQEAYIRKVLRSAGIVVTISRTTYVNQKRKAEATERYKAKFSELGQSGFEYIEFARKDSHVFRCNRCGAELRRGSDIFKGKQNKLICRNCGNGTITYSPFVDEVLEYYSQKHSFKETCEKFNLEKWQLNEWAKRRHVSNGRTISEINKEKSKIRAEQQRTVALTSLIPKIESRGFIYLSGYEKSDCFIKVQCKTCGEITERSVQPFRKGEAVCQTCRHKETLQRQAEAKRLKAIESEKKKEELEARKLEREKDKCRKFDEVFNCRVCGKEYTPRQYMESCGLTLFSNVGYCSKTCRYNDYRRKQNEAKRKSGRRFDKHYHRAKKLGLPAERGITLPKLIARDGLNCAICGLVCFYEGDTKSDLYPSIDHIVPIDKGGGHVWSNVQVAHRICNSIKSNKIGVKYGNDKIYKTA